MLKASSTMPPWLAFKVCAKTISGALPVVPTPVIPIQSNDGAAKLLHSGGEVKLQRPLSPLLSAALSVGRRLAAVRLQAVASGTSGIWSTAVAFLASSSGLVGEQPPLFSACSAQLLAISESGASPYFFLLPCFPPFSFYSSSCCCFSLHLRFLPPLSPP